MLRAAKPQTQQKRLKLFLYGPAGVGKTTAAVQFPHAYIIDCERGAENYDRLINDNGGVLFQTNDMADVIQEVKSLLTVQHDYRTLVIDPITTLYNDLLEKCEHKVGTDFGRHYGEANKTMKRLANLILALDMNVVVTAHAKKEYGENLKVLGQTFDGWRQLDYWFDLVVELGKGRGKNGRRTAKVIKTRLEAFPDEELFEWTYDAIRKRYGAGILEKAAEPVRLADPRKVAQLREIIDLVRLPDGLIEKWFSKANVDRFEDMPADVLEKCLDYVRDRLPGQTHQHAAA